MAMAYMAAFATLLAVLRWWLDADPMRSTRLSLWSLLVTVVFAHVIATAWQFPEPWLMMVAACMSVSVQLSSPWVPTYARLRPATEKSDLAEEGNHGCSGYPGWPRGVGGLALRACQRTCQPPHAPLRDRPGSASSAWGSYSSSLALSRQSASGCRRTSPRSSEQTQARSHHGTPGDRVDARTVAAEEFRQPRPSGRR